MTKMTPTTRGYKNCNPGNIENSKEIFRGEIIPSQDRRFKQFLSMPYGYRAMFVVLNTYRKRGLDTIEKIINSWAPSVENHTEIYINEVVKRSEVSRNKVLSGNSGLDYIKIVAAMSYVENGIEADIKDVEEGFQLQNKISL